MRLASLLHCMPRICSLSWLWQPVGAMQGAFSTLCSIFSQWYHLLFILSPFQSASSVCRMTRCLGMYVCAWALKAQSMCVGGGGCLLWSFEHVFFLTDRNNHLSQRPHWKVHPVCSWRSCGSFPGDLVMGAWFHFKLKFRNVHFLYFLHRYVVKNLKRKADLYPGLQDESTRVAFADYTVSLPDATNSWVLVFRSENILDSVKENYQPVLENPGVNDWCPLIVLANYSFILQSFINGYYHLQENKLYANSGYSKLRHKTSSHHIFEECF